MTQIPSKTLINPLAILAAVLVSACGAKSKGDASPAPAPAAEPEAQNPAALTAAIQGKWLLPCVATDAGDTDLPQGTLGQSSIYTFGTKAVLEDDYFRDASCQQPLIKIVLSASYAVGAALPNLSGAHALDLQDAQVVATPQDVQHSVDNPCDGGAKLTTTAQCTAPAAFQIVKVDGGQLYLGYATSGHDGATADSRPQEWASGFTKQP